jgi:hypothetical protein
MLDEWDDGTGDTWNPKLYECPKCKTQLHFQVNAGWIESPITLRDNPMCPKCWDEFLQSLGFEMVEVKDGKNEG